MVTRPLIFEISRPGRCATALPALDVPTADLPSSLLRDDLPLPEVSEIDLVRHYTRLSQLNYGVDTGFYPLGSCTMKYNPKINEQMARLPGFARLHPYQDEETAQGALFLMYHLQEFLAEIGGFAAVSLQPAAGAHGELTGVLMMRAYHLDRGDDQRDVILVPDSAHGTNPATTTMSGLKVIEIPSDARGNVDMVALEAACEEHGDRLVGMMLTNPNTLGLFDEHVEEITALVHEHGGLMYGDGANMNALLGIARPGDLGFDVLHYNLHKTFSTPHGGGGPGSGPVGASERLAEFLPLPIVDVDLQRSDDEELFYTFVDPPKSIGRVKAFYGHFGVLVRAYVYIRMLGADGLRRVAEHAVLNANYLKGRLEGTYPLPYDRTCMHEFVLAGPPDDVQAAGVHTLDVAKRLMDYGFHPPTVYFPLIVHEALMIEPTETESLETLDGFVEALLRIADEARADPDLLHAAPHNAPMRRLDEVHAAKKLTLRWKPE
ncbi:MAG: aminomethyl-transferring glycine dehydrogenase subunit GcvPB [Chloroflexi bacterium]|nr:MAG: glycine dehydrogenase (aminomethyl-transferring) [Anaerolineaceae bacterium 4572_32.2]RLC82200.1 MAG: aminomethyl-transferring glycine dehydrogenase subunit GcvPB [Chloroflexota bacterium]RLC86264.1 MAG: aminomethyl-transferring glycine dehydrogenase subunit GcvPB [Chloroflexota bacterium]HEY73992.1 glycine dehydrogenase subunit 2 [Thermoflexia bacterium]